MAILDCSKDNLHKLFSIIKVYFADSIRLKVNSNYQVGIIEDDIDFYCLVFSFVYVIYEMYS
jgi:hypothetical protein